MNEEERAALTETSEGVKNLTDQTRLFDRRLADMNTILLALVVALFIGFSGTFVAATAMLVESFNDKSASYRELQDEVRALRNEGTFLVNPSEPQVTDVVVSPTSP